VVPLHCDRSRLEEAQFLAVTRQDSLDVAAILLLSAHPTTNPSSGSTKPRPTAKPTKIRDVNFIMRGDSYLQCA
jgi:hypothetical protein